MTELTYKSVRMALRKIGAMASFLVLPSDELKREAEYLNGVLEYDACNETAREAALCEFELSRRGIA